MNTVIPIPGIGDVVLVDREQLRFREHGRVCSIPRHLSALMEAIPPAPATFDWSKAEQLKFPILGNNRYGDCYYAAVAHASQAYTGNAGLECSFDEHQLTQRYLKIAGGDNGLDDGTIFPEWRSGIVGPNGPRKILDEMTVRPSDAESVKLAMWAFCGLVWTCSLPGNWANNASPGATWDRAGRSVGGHAMLLTGCNAKGGYDVRTWGLSPPIHVTIPGLLSADPELIVAFSLDMFTAEGISPCGATYDQLAALWAQLGGKPLPANPFPPATPIDWYA